MLDKIISFSIKNKMIIGIFTIALIIWGSYSLSKLPIDAVPDITNNQVQIITLSPSLASQEVERLITFPIEQTMATIPKLEEVRSISRFGLSVVTIVFKDGVDIYWARQQVSEKLIAATKEIPNGIGSPELSPISSGLGEIYQYVVHAKKGYEKKYNAAELRTIQDWIIRRQLLGIPGIAEVNSFGGILKQYEIALNPDRLRSYGISIGDVYEALQRNNQNTGGSYIDKKPNAYFIRTEGLIKSLSDIETIIVKNIDNGAPVLIRDIAKVQFGSANRYGALTRNAEGEAVGGIVMMLKGENSNIVVTAVKERIADITKSLPEGVQIEPYLDRSELVKKAIDTVKNNLIEGALIVIFVLVLFLGNLRAGLVVASVIPLAMLFAISMMNLFGVSGNLMSLGAIDFGLVVDGAVIIVEATLHHLHYRSNKNKLTQTEMDGEVYHAAVQIRSSAAFGEIIILIVYLPLLALVGIEGKMFGPMAQTVSFAILGAFILSLTYVPMASALFLSKKIPTKKTFSDKMIEFFQRLYTPILIGALKRKLLTVASAVGLFIVCIIIFMNMGGEFIPTLEEGDFAVETRLLTGSSMSETVEKVTMASDILIKKFPEVKEIIGKIGAAEIPTDPMPMEACDLTIMLKPKSEWTSAHDREELANKMQEALENIPGVNFGFSQPIQLRFNELISGVRQDVGIKIFGDDMDELATLAEKIGKLSGTTEGAKDIYVEKVGGLPQIVVNINRGQLAKFGLDIETVNQAVNTAFAGQSAGIVYEGEKRFDLVLRLDKQSRQTLADVQNLYVSNKTGQQIPLSQLADVSMKIGPNQVQREEGKRRIIVGFNVRGRDIASVVKEIQGKIDANVKLPSGYFIRYGGQFKNLEEASKRLSIAVPVSLALIILLLYFTFSSFNQALLIFSAIPMAAIGGVFALLLRGMPFSISAGVGFIALFGVAVLNGLVLIGEFNRLRASGLTDIKEIILKGTSVRLRPVLMTAFVASLGFLPMALATSNGAEVQRPLATVVIGGLISSTILTLVVLPCLFIYFEKMRKKFVDKKMVAVSIILLTLIPQFSSAQNGKVIDDWISAALKNNNSLLAADKEIQQYQFLRKTASDIGKTNVNLTYGQYNSYAKSDNNITISQSIPFPTTIAAKNKLAGSYLEGSMLKKKLTETEVIYNVKQIYYDWLYLNQRRELLLKRDSLYSNLTKASDLRYKTGESTLLEKSTSEARSREIKNQLEQLENDRNIISSRLKAILNSAPANFTDSHNDEAILSFKVDSALSAKNPYVMYIKQQIQIAENQKKVEKNTLLPDITFGYFNQTLYGVPYGNDLTTAPLAGYGNRFQGFMAGVAIPLWIGPQRAKIKAAELLKENTELVYKQAENNIIAEITAAYEQYLKGQRSLAYYKESGMPNAALISSKSTLSFQKGEISYAEHVINLQQAEDIKQNYLSTLLDYNRSIITLEFLSGLTK
ncbi:MAG: CusA/CzcA family heavy metal efflux RND transporter [Bacteroidetes bacterium]|nr:CusA/CzcA family heavy metal efflux RND transporter [Bacteroidota bacterium]